jgi:hypothetical protein
MTFEKLEKVQFGSIPRKVIVCCRWPVKAALHQHSTCRMSTTHRPHSIHWRYWFHVSRTSNRTWRLCRNGWRPGTLCHNLCDCINFVQHFKDGNWKRSIPVDYCVWHEHCLCQTMTGGQFVYQEGGEQGVEWMLTRIFVQDIHRRLDGLCERMRELGTHCTEPLCCILFSPCTVLWIFWTTIDLSQNGRIYLGGDGVYTHMIFSLLTT